MIAMFSKTKKISSQEQEGQEWQEFLVAQEFLVVFSPLGKRFSHMLLKSGFRHVLVLTKELSRSDKDTWQIYEISSRMRLGKTVDHFKRVKLIERFKYIGCRVLNISRVKTKYPLESGIRSGIYCNCVILSKQLLGINNIIIQTPWQLYQHLLSIGGSEE